MPAAQRNQRFGLPPAPPPDDRKYAATLAFIYASLAISFLVLVAAAVIPTSPISPMVRSAQDLASFANGGRIIDAHTSTSLPTPIAGLYDTAVADDRLAHLIRKSGGPSSQAENALGVVPDKRALWFFNGTQGSFAVHLSNPSVVGAVEFKGHPVKRSCLPRDFNVWGLVMPEEVGRLDHSVLPWQVLPDKLRGRVSVQLSRSFNPFAPARKDPYWLALGRIRNAQRNRHGNDFKPHPAILEANVPVHVLAIDFVRNWGESYSCFAGLSVFGTVGRV